MSEQPELLQRELIARERRRFRRGIWLGLGLGIAFVALVFLLFSLPQSPVKETLISYLEPTFTVLLAATVIGSIVWRARSKARAREEVEGLKLIDERQTQTRWVNRIILFVVALLAVEMERDPTFLHDGGIATKFAILTATMALMVCYGPEFAKWISNWAMDDELARASRARAASVAYVVVMLALSILFLLALFRPSSVITAIPFAMVVGVAVPILYLELLEWRANRSA